ncbi:MAG: hypothetical protein HY352_02860 [Candidatus Omnitrophica bacterium]|nr:hypothetical protein [Candidatus Omnitrophota bacterium]
MSQAAAYEMDEVVGIIMSMFEQNIQEPNLFIEALRQYHEANTAQRGDLANALSELIIRKRVDLAQVRQLLLREEEHALISTLDALLDLIEPYLEEGGVDE